MTPSAARHPALKRLCSAFAAAIVLSFPVPTLQAQAKTPAPRPKIVETCAAHAAPKAFAEKLPALHEMFQKVAGLPLTGKPVTDVLRNPAHGFQSCFMSAFPDTRQGDFIANKIRVLKSETNGQAYIHEMFHGAQQANGSGDMPGTETMRMEDSIEGNMLIEATAVGYSFAAYKEMSKTDPQAYEDFANSGYAFGMKEYFEKAYGEAFEKLTALAPALREKKALEAGGKAVVKALLEGRDSYWTSTYANYAIENAPTYGGLSVERNDPAYARTRRDLYLKAGAISPGFNLTPDDLLGPRAVRAIDGYLKAQGIEFTYK